MGNVGRLPAGLGWAGLGWAGLGWARLEVPAAWAGQQLRPPWVQCPVPSVLYTDNTARGYTEYRPMPL